MPARSKSQQRLFGMVHAYQKGELEDAPEHIKDIAKHISKEDAEHFAKTKHRKLPEKKAGIADNDEGKMKRRIGLALLGIGVGGPLALGAHQMSKVYKAVKMIGKGSLKSRAEVDRYIAQHLKAVGKKLPKYRWSTLDDIKRNGKLGIGSIRSDAEIASHNKHIRELNDARRDGIFRMAFPGQPLQSSKVIPVYADGNDVLKGMDHLTVEERKNSILARIKEKLNKLARMGGHFDNEAGYVSLGVKGHGLPFIKDVNVLNPKTLLHELGHAQDAINGKLKLTDRGLYANSIKDWFNRIRNPDSTPLLQTEIRAWDNAGIAKGNKQREAALNTYRNAVRAANVSPLFTPVTLAGGITYHKGRKERQ